MINRNKLEHILEYAKQQRHIGQSCKVPPEDMVEIMERLLSACNPPAQSDCCPAQNHVSPEQNGYTPAQSQGWIQVSEQMPEIGDIVLTAMGGVVNVGEMECSAANCRFFTSVISGRELPATHWMPLPAAPQEVKR